MGECKLDKQMMLVRASTWFETVDMGCSDWAKKK